MSATRVSLAVAVAVGASIWCAVDSRVSSADAPDDQWAVVQNHLYIERLPRDERDMIHQIVFVDHRDIGRIGARVHASHFRVFIDNFAWSRRGDTLAMKILQTDKSYRGTFRAWSCAGQAPAPFELCLELREGDRTRKYFSRKDWIIDKVEDAHALADSLTPRGVVEVDLAEAAEGDPETNGG
ncbi:MAG: hypothetical protein IT383_17000 [Deltaproteobacteria bacterium]|nr:hypothetical protein [Deltaproteobacteria bacterium]